MYSEAFRAPSIENINTAQGGKIKPEKSNVFEAELGYQFTPEMLFSVNAFSINTDNVIIYIPVPDPNDDTKTVDSYKNYERSGTSGFELQYSYRKNKNYLTIGYSYSVANNTNTVDKYQIPQTSSQFVGQLRGKLTLNGSVTLTPKLSVNPSLIIGGRRFAYTGFVVTGIDASGNDIREASATELPAYALANLFLNYKNLGLKGLDIGLGVFDLFNQRPAIPQMYNGDYAPIPLRSTELVVRLMYQLDFKK